mmetsp:Transcript_72191/g.155981  ORF Transcript_72191/g.155981 Transcript_72191/m.155981 type:complete len:208 (-) Transcript_72191:260-883(-)
MSCLSALRSQCAQSKRSSPTRSSLHASLFSHPPPTCTLNLRRHPAHSLGWLYIRTVPSPCPSSVRPAGQTSRSLWTRTPPVPSGTAAPTWSTKAAPRASCSPRPVPCFLTPSLPWLCTQATRGSCSPRTPTRSRQRSLSQATSTTRSSTGQATCSSRCTWSSGATSAPPSSTRTIRPCSQLPYAACETTSSDGMSFKWSTSPTSPRC